MDEMLICEVQGNSVKIQCRLFRISTNLTDEKTDIGKMNVFLETKSIVEFKSQYVTSKTDYWHIFVAYYDTDTKALSETNSDVNQSVATVNNIDTNDARLVKKLKEWRKEEACRKGWPAYRVLTNSTIDELSARNPTAIEHLKSVKGIGASIEKNFGRDIINIITKHLEES